MHLPPTFIRARRLLLVGNVCGAVAGCKSAPSRDRPAPDGSDVDAPSLSVGSFSTAEVSESTAMDSSTPLLSSHTGGAPLPTSTDASGEESSPSLPIEGRIIDFWGHSVPDVTVAIDAAETVSDAEGRFTLRAVPPYNVSLAVRIRGEVTEIYGYHFVGLNRQDPTLQIFKGLPQRTSPLTIRVPEIDEHPRWVGEIALGGQHGQRAYVLAPNAEVSAGWRGPNEQVSNMQVLVWETSELDRRVPDSFLFWQTGSLSLAESVAATIDVELPANPSPLLAHEISMVTENAPGTSHIAASYVRFDGGPSIALSQIPRLSDDPLPFVTLAPQLSDASVTLAAISGNGAHDTPFSIVYANQVQGGDSTTLTFGVSSELVTPPDDATEVALSTPFSWTHTAETYIATFEDLDVYQTVYVITSQPNAVVPNLESLGIYYPHGGAYRWAVESHGDARDLDELCSPPGYLDPFSGDFHYPMGPRRGAGRYWRSASRSFVFE